MLDSLIIEIYRLECLFTWGILSGIARSGLVKDGDKLMELETNAMSAYIQYQDAEHILPKEIKLKIVQFHKVWLVIIFGFYLIGIINKVLVK